MNITVIEVTSTAERIRNGSLIITRTPFRITLGGGGTDLPSYYEKHGGFILTSAIDKYMYVAINTPFVDHLLRVKYSMSETVENVAELKHELAREALKHFGIEDTLEILSFADISAGTGMGSSSCYLVGLLKALEVYKRQWMSEAELAELACEIEINRLGKPIGKQDAYIAANGGLLCMEIGKDGRVKAEPANIRMSVIRDLEYNLLLFYSGLQRRAEDVLAEQNSAMKQPGNVRRAAVEESLNYIKKLGYETLDSLKSGDLRGFARLMDVHWNYKKKMSDKITHPKIDAAYETAKRHGALGGKLIGAGGGGFLLVYAENSHREIDEAMREQGFRRLDFRFDFEGSKSLLNLVDSRIEYNHQLEKNKWRK